MVDLNRGVTKRKHPAGVQILMYKDVPGEYFDINDEPVSESMARAAGYDVDRLETERKKREKIEAARRDIEEEFEAQSKVMEQLLDSRSESYAARHVGGGKYGIFDAEGTRLTHRPMNKAEAEGLIKKLELPTVGAPRPRADASGAAADDGKDAEDPGQQDNTPAAE